MLLGFELASSMMIIEETSSHPTLSTNSQLAQSEITAYIFIIEGILLHRGVTERTVRVGEKVGMKVF